jgi:phage shock protein C
MTKPGTTPKFEIRPMEGDTNQGKKKSMTKLSLNRTSKKILGVCAGLADWSGIDVTVVRVAFVLTTLIGFGSPILIYIALGLILD